MGARCDAKTLTRLPALIADGARCPRCSRCVRLKALRVLRMHRAGRLAPSQEDVRKALKDTAVAAIAESIRGEVLHHDLAKLSDMTLAIAVLVLLRVLSSGRP